MLAPRVSLLACMLRRPQSERSPRHPNSSTITTKVAVPGHLEAHAVRAKHLAGPMAVEFLGRSC
eukprot:2888401-Rhodomonas_salina.1